jgi:hypothetical protein
MKLIGNPVGLGDEVNLFYHIKPPAHKDLFFVLKLHGLACCIYRSNLDSF